jgi:hypothetical protein
MPRGSPLHIAWLVLTALIAFSSSAWGQTADQSANQSTIFPSISAKAKRDAAVWSEPDVKQTSPTRKTVFEHPDPAAGAPQPVPPTAVGSPSMIGALAAPAAPGDYPDFRGRRENGTAPFNPQQPAPGNECCPQCGRPLDHPILGACDNCGPVRRFLYMLSPAHIFAGRPGSPVYHEPWIDRPFSVGLFAGPIVGSPLINDWVGQQTGTLAGMRFGWDFDDDWGMELRLATANIPLYDEPPAILAQQAQTGGGLPIPYLAGTRNSDHFIWDIDFLYYPWGDDHFRPYLLFGVGTDRVKFADRLGIGYARILLEMPVGLGFKYHMNDWLIFRVEFTDNIAMAGGSIFQTQQNFSATGAFEVRLGRTKIQYWPWNPGR